MCEVLEVKVAIIIVIRNEKLTKLMSQTMMILLVHELKLS